MKDLLKGIDEDIEIDPDALDEACLNQHKILLEYGSRYIDALDIKRGLEKDAKKLYNKLSANFTGRKPKLTKEAVKLKVESTESYEEAVDEVWEQEKIVKRLSLVKEVLGHRKSMLRELVFLTAIGYRGQLKMSDEMKRIFVGAVGSRFTGGRLPYEKTKISKKQSTRLIKKIKKKKGNKRNEQ